MAPCINCTRAAVCIFIACKPDPDPDPDPASPWYFYNVWDQNVLMPCCMSPRLQREVAAFSARIQQTFSDGDLLLLAVTHR